jgi:cytidyltransferase-like protein
MMDAKRKTVFVTGCFDLLHSGHIAFLEEAAGYGELVVGIGSDDTVRKLKGRFPVYTEQERQYMLEALRCVRRCTINSGDGVLDFADDLKVIRPDILFVNEDGNTPEKEELCRERGIEYIVSRRIPHASLPSRSTTALRTECNIPYRIDLAGGWLDQPYVSKFAPGSVLTISIEPTIELNDRSGMATSTRRKAIELWKTDLPGGDREKLARMLFSYENPPGTEVISGSQDALGIVLPGLNRLDYKGGYWPEKIEPCLEEDVLAWLEDRISLVMLGPREDGFSVLSDTNITAATAGRLAVAADRCWKAILQKDIAAFGVAFTESFEAQVAMFPHMADGPLRLVISSYESRARGWKLSGAGGGGYLILVSDHPVSGTMKIKIRRP